MTDDEVIAAVHEAARWEHDDWAHPSVIAIRLHCARSTAVRRCTRLAEDGLLESATKYGWRHSKSVKSIRFRTPRGTAVPE